MDLNTLLKHTSRSLYLSAKILPQRIRPAFGVAYLLCRYADTIADTALLPASKRLAWIKKFPQIVRTHNVQEQQALVQDLTGTSENPYEKELIVHLNDCLMALHQIDPKLLPPIYEVVQAVCEGMQLDLETFNQTNGLTAFQTKHDLTHYCRLMGGKPGLFWSRLIYHVCTVELAHDTFNELGQQVGDALQIVNILRDLPKDLQNFRCYFPIEQLRPQGLTPVDLLQPENTSRFEPIKCYWLYWGHQNLQQAICYFKALPKTQPRIRAAVAWPMLWTADTYIKLANCPDLLDATKRVKISRYTIYLTIFLTPFLLGSNALFSCWLTHKLNKLLKTLNQNSPQDKEQKC